MYTPLMDIPLADTKTGESPNSYPLDTIHFFIDWYHRNGPFHTIDCPSLLQKTKPFCVLYTNLITLTMSPSSKSDRTFVSYI